MVFETRKPNVQVRTGLPFGPKPRPGTPLPELRIPGEERFEKFIKTNTPGTKDFSKRESQRIALERKEKQTTGTTSAFAPQYAREARITRVTQEKKLQEAQEKEIYQKQREQKLNQLREQALTNRQSREKRAQEKHETSKKESESRLQKYKAETEKTEKQKELTQERLKEKAIPKVNKDDYQKAEEYMNNRDNQRITEKAIELNKERELKQYLASEYKAGRYPDQEDVNSYLTKDKNLSQTAKDERDYRYQ